MPAFADVEHYELSATKSGGRVRQGGRDLIYSQVISGAELTEEGFRLKGRF